MENIKSLEGKTSSRISAMTAGLVLTLAAIAFTLSYNALRDVAVTHGVGEWLSYLWPLLIDFALLVFSLAVLRANLRGERAWWPWALVGIFTLGTVGFNFFHAQADSIPVWAVAVAAPIALFFSFETLMGMVRAEVKRAGVADTVTHLLQRQVEAVAVVADLDRQVAEMTAKAEAIKAELAELRKEKRQGYTGVSEETKAAAMALLGERSGLSGAELGRLLGKSDSLGRKLKRELLPVVNGSGNGVSSDDTRSLH